MDQPGTSGRIEGSPGMLETVLGLVTTWISQSQDSQHNDVFSIEQPRVSRQLLANRVAGVGAGVFVFFFFLALCISICLLGSRTKVRWLIYTISSAIFLIVALVLLASPKGEKPEEPSTGYDQTIVPLVIIMVLLVLGILLAGVGMLVFQAVHQSYARPLSYHADIDRQY